MANRTERNRRYQEKIKAERAELAQLRKDMADGKLIYTTPKDGGGTDLGGEVVGRLGGVVGRGGSQVLFNRGDEYEAASDTEFSQGKYLLSEISVLDGDSILDVGCGTGLLSLEIAKWFPTCSVVGIDISPDMIATARSHLDNSISHRVRFGVANLFSFAPDSPYDVIFSSSAMHWMLPPEESYQCIFNILKHGGQLVVHQGGHGTYRGLHQCAFDVVDMMGFGSRFEGWTYPAYYPTSDQLSSLLEQVGFIDINVEARETDGSEFPTLYRDFANAGLLPFLVRIPEAEREAFRSLFIEHANRIKADKYTHRLFATAMRP